MQTRIITGISLLLFLITLAVMVGFIVKAAINTISKRKEKKEIKASLIRELIVCTILEISFYIMYLMALDLDKAIIYTIVLVFIWIFYLVKRKKLFR